MYIVQLEHIQTILTTLHEQRYTTIGPVVRDGAVVLGEVRSCEDLPHGIVDEQQPGSYRLHAEGTGELFRYVVGPQSWKAFLFPARVKLFSARRNGKGFRVESESEAPIDKLAFIGVRSCELTALNVLDTILLDGPYVDGQYRRRREQVFILAVNCTKPGGNCFCASMKTGPRARGAYDLALTEIYREGCHYFLVEVGSEAGQCVLQSVPHRAAQQHEIEEALRALDEAAARMSKRVETEGIVEILNERFEHPHWDDIAKRCLACANCTMVCPTCFCTNVEDVTDLSGERAERWRVWDSCFTSDFTRIAGGNIRLSTRTRYRQWLMHKFAHWQGQFNTFGCVGCGRCITWCPAAIDITQELETFRSSSVPTTIS